MNCNRETRTIRRILYFLTDTNLFIAACAGTSAAGILPYFGYPPDRKLAWFVFFGTLFTYNAQRRIGDLYPRREFSKIGDVLMALSFLAIAVLVPQLPPTEIAVLAVSGVLSLAYAYPLLPFRGRKLSLRRVPYIKLWLIVLVWLLSTVVAPMLQAKTFLLQAHPFNPVFIVLQQGAFIAALTIPFDIRDMNGDYVSQRTLPQVLGVRRARNLAILLLGVSAMAALGLAAIGTVEWKPAGAHWAVCILAAAVVSRADAGRGDLYHYVLVDGTILLQGAVFLTLWLSG